ncbi:MAG: DinB family protein [Chitinophagaceae bacterium]|nr:MAG: DinB family protein [Chitinophagaceae bacterium]
MKTTNMKDNQRLRKLFEDHFEGEPWIDVQIWNAIKDLPYADAAKNVYGLNSIWQMVQHMASWRQTLLRRLTGEHIPSPANNYFEPIPVINEQAWQNTLQQLRHSQEALLNYLESGIQMDEVQPGSSYSRYELLQGLLQHDAYHLGQIVLVRKLISIGFTPQ